MHQKLGILYALKRATLEPPLQRVDASRGRFIFAVSTNQYLHHSRSALAGLGLLRDGLKHL